MAVILTSMVKDALADLEFAKCRLHLAQDAMAEADCDLDVDLDAVESCIQTANHYIHAATQKLDALLKGG